MHRRGAGSDTAAELERVETQISRLRSEQDAGLVVTDEDHAEYLARMQRLVAARTGLLDSKPVKPGWVYRSTPETFKSVWRKLPTPEGVAERRQMLVDSGVRFDLVSTNPLEYRLTIQR